MPTTTTRGFQVPALTGDGSDLHEMFQDLADTIEAYLDADVELGGSLNLSGDVITDAGAFETSVAGGFAAYHSRDPDASANLKRGRYRSRSGKTELASLNDDLSVRKLMLQGDHDTGTVDFPNGLTATDGAFSDDLTVADDAAIGGDLAVTGAAQVGGLTVGTTPLSDVIGAYRDVATAGGGSAVAAAVGTYMLGRSGALYVPGSSAVALASVAFYLDPSDYEMTGKATKLRVRASLHTNAVSPGTTFTVGLAPAVVGGGSGSPPSASVAGAQVGAAVAFVSPAATGGNPTSYASAGADFNAPAAGWYLLTVVQAGAAAANSAVSLSARLQVRNA